LFFEDPCLAEFSWPVFPGTRNESKLNKKKEAESDAARGGRTYDSEFKMYGYGK
jgi:hypothetical protein